MKIIVNVSLSHNSKTLFDATTFTVASLFSQVPHSMSDRRAFTMSLLPQHIRGTSPSFPQSAQETANMPSGAYPISKDLPFKPMIPRPISTQSTGVGVPADYLDPNHPHFPHDDLEAQPSVRSHYKYAPCLSKKAVLILTGVFLILGSFALAVLTGIKISVGQAKAPSNSSTPVQTVYHTTTINATALVPVVVTPTTTVTMFTTVSAPTSSPTPGCTSTGEYVNKQECEKQCNNFAVEVNTSATCEAGSSEKWTCKVCTGVFSTFQSPSPTPSPTPIAPSAPLRPTATPKVPTGNCIAMGKFQDETECNEVCAQMDAKTDKDAKCSKAGSKTNTWSCIVCPAGIDPSDRLIIEGPPS